jgi:DNA adenine methylase
MKSTKRAKPFLKWAGGKTHLLPQIQDRLPPGLGSKPFTYIEPFVGSGAMLFWVLQEFPSVNKVYINDINTDLTNAYDVISNELNELIQILRKWEVEYHKILKDEVKKKAYFYKKRDIFNTRNSSKITQTALLIFLNKTCFNGLFRVNRKNEFNVPIGSYKSPKICQEENLRLVSLFLQKVTILNGDYENVIQYADNDSFVYLDPPYKPISSTSNFNAYSQCQFEDTEQINLKEFCDLLHQKGVKWMMSNSDVKSINPTEDFFDELYQSYNIQRVLTPRRINSNPDKRGKLSELLITNY